MLKRNGYVLEQLLSPLVIRSSAAHQRMKELSEDCITRHLAHHYLGFAKNQWNLFSKEPMPLVKPLLYCFRVLLTGIHVMKTGKIEANLSHLNEEYRLPYLADLMDLKVHGEEKCQLPNSDISFFHTEFQRLEKELLACYEKSHLPDNPAADRLNQLLIDIRKESFVSSS